MVEVTQADREAAASGYYAWCSGNPVIPNRMIDGHADDHSMVQAFARHRLAERDAAFADGFSAAIQGAEAAIWEVEDDAFLYPTVSDALQEVIAGLQEMESNWTKRSSVNHRHAVQAEAQLAQREAVVKWLRKDDLVVFTNVLADAIEAGEHLK